MRKNRNDFYTRHNKLQRISKEDITKLFSMADPKDKHIKQFMKQYVLDIQRHWEEFVGNLLAVHSRPYRIENEKLFVEADHPIYAQQIHLLQKHILSKITKKLNLTLHVISSRVCRLKWEHLPMAHKEDMITQKNNKEPETSFFDDILQKIQNLTTH